MDGDEPVRLLDVGREPEVHGRVERLLAEGPLDVRGDRTPVLVADFDPVVDGDAERPIKQDPDRDLAVA
eukprot:11004072-Lingulodinium_polyedra.AAC.2